MRAFRRDRLRKLRLGGALAAAATTGRRRPVFVGWSLTDTCNLSCTYCGRWDRGSPELPPERMLALADEMADAGVQRVSLTGGEPLVHPACVPLAERFAARGVAVSLNTNGALLGRHLDAIAPHLSAVTFSIDGGEAAHDAVRGEGSWRAAVEAAEACTARGLDIALHAVVSVPTLGEVGAMLALAERLDCKAGFTVVEDVPAMGRRDLKPLTPTPDQWRAVVDELLARKAAGERRIQNSVAGLKYLRGWPEYAPIGCSAGLVYARIEPDGRLFGCGNLVSSTPGEDLGERSFGDAWEDLTRDRCEACWCDTRVEMNLILAGVPSALRAAWTR